MLESPEFGRLMATGRFRDSAFDWKEKSVQSWQRGVVFFDHLITLSALANTFGGIVRPVECNSTTPVNVLGWVDNSANENGFVIERKAEAGGTYAVLATVDPGTISYTDKTGVFGATYFYRVKAINTFGNILLIATRYRFHD